MYYCSYGVLLILRKNIKEEERSIAKLGRTTGLHLGLFFGIESKWERNTNRACSKKNSTTTAPDVKWTGLKRRSMVYPSRNLSQYGLWCSAQVNFFNLLKIHDIVVMCHFISSIKPF